jgi:uncharacterized protein (DUF608 family)
VGYILPSSLLLLSSFVLHAHLARLLYYTLSLTLSLAHSLPFSLSAPTGQWWARACGLPPLDDVECYQSALATIYKFNVKKFKNGELGPINGMRPDGKIDQTCMQSVEVWGRKRGKGYKAAKFVWRYGPGLPMDARPL